MKAENSDAEYRIPTADHSNGGHSQFNETATLKMNIQEHTLTALSRNNNPSIDDLLNKKSNTKLKPLKLKKLENTSVEEQTDCLIKYQQTRFLNFYSTEQETTKFEKLIRMVSKNDYSPILISEKALSAFQDMITCSESNDFNCRQVII